MTAAAVHTRLRKICLQWPETQETIKWGHPVFVAGKRMFAAYGVDYDKRPSFSFKLDYDRWDDFVDDVTVTPAPYAARFGWVRWFADGKLNWKLLEQLLLDSYKAVALKRMLIQLDASSKRR